MRFLPPGRLDRLEELEVAWAYAEAGETWRANLQRLITGLAAFLPTLTVLVAMLQNHSRFNSLAKRIDDIAENRA